MKGPTKMSTSSFRPDTNTLSSSLYPSALSLSLSLSLSVFNSFIWSGKSLI